MIEIKDRVPKYPNRKKITKENGQVEYATVEYADEPTEKGTPINKALLDEILGNLYSSDRYNEISYNEVIGEAKNYTNGNYIADFTYDKLQVLGSGTFSYATGFFNSKTANGVKNGFLIKFRHEVKINTINLNGNQSTSNTSNPMNFIIQVSKDSKTWTNIHTNSTEILYTTNGTNVTINSSDYCRYIRVILTHRAESALLYFKITNCQYKETSYRYSSKIPLLAYEKNKILKVQGGRILRNKASYTDSTVSSNLSPLFTNSYNQFSSDYQRLWKISAWGDNDDDTLIAKSAFDGDTTTYIGDDRGFGAQIESVPMGDASFAIKPTKILVNAYIYTDLMLYGRKLDGTWDTLKTWPHSKGTTVSETITLSGNTFYTAFKLRTYIFGDDTYPKLYEFRIVAGTIRTGILEDKYTESVNNAYINVNDLGDKKVLEPLSYGSLYDLMYNGEGWAKVQSTSVLGTFNIPINNSNDKIIEVKLGFKPKMVFITPETGAPTIITTTDLIVTNRITSNGFMYEGAKGSSYNYIAIT